MVHLHRARGDWSYHDGWTDHTVPLDTGIGLDAVDIVTGADGALLGGLMASWRDLMVPYGFARRFRVINHRADYNGLSVHRIPRSRTDLHHQRMTRCINKPSREPSDYRPWLRLNPVVVPQRLSVSKVDCDRAVSREASQEKRNGTPAGTVRTGASLKKLRCLAKACQAAG